MGKPITKIVANRSKYQYKIDTIFVYYDKEVEQIMNEEKPNR